MASKFMKIKRIIIPFISLVILTSQLMGCAAMSQEEVASELANGTEVEIELAEPSGEQEQEKENIPVPDGVYVEVYDEAAEEKELGYEPPPVTVTYTEEADTNSDGNITLEEWQAWVDVHPEDLDQDLIVTDEERAAYEQQQSGSTESNNSDSSNSDSLSGNNSTSTENNTESTSTESSTTESSNTESSSNQQAPVAPPPTYNEQEQQEQDGEVKVSQEAVDAGVTYNSIEEILARVAELDGPRTEEEIRQRRENLDNMVLPPV